MADPFVAAAGDQFIEAFQPAQATTAVELYEGRIDHFLDWRIPTHAHVTDRGLQDVHAASWNYRKFHRAVIDVDDADAFLPTAVQGAQGHAERFVDFYAELLAGDLPVLGGFVGVEQDVIPGQGLGGSGQCAEGNEEFEWGHGNSLSWSCAIFIDLMKRFSKHKSRDIGGFIVQLRCTTSGNSMDRTSFCRKSLSRRMRSPPGRVFGHTR
ncbi:hypothetical protein D3C81_1459620 [compost metagenome]